MNKTLSDGNRQRLHPVEKLDRLIGALQERFGYSRERAVRELMRRLAKHLPRATRARTL